MGWGQLQFAISEYVHAHRTPFDERILILKSFLNFIYSSGYFRCSKQLILRFTFYAVG